MASWEEIYKSPSFQSRSDADRMTMLRGYVRKYYIPKSSYQNFPTEKKNTIMSVMMKDAGLGLDTSPPSLTESLWQDVKTKVPSPHIKALLTPPPVSDFQEPTMEAPQEPSVAGALTDPQFYGEMARDAGGVVAKAGAGLVKGATLGGVDPEAGNLGIPFTDIKVKYAPPLGDSLRELGVSKEIANNPYIQLAPQMFATIAPWATVSKVISALTTGKAIVKGGVAAQKTMAEIVKGVSKRTAIQAATGAVIGAAHVREEEESLLENTLTGAAYGAGLNLLAEGFYGIAKATTSITKNRAFIRLKDDMADLLYRQGAYKTPEAAEEQAAKVVSNMVAKAGGIDKVTAKTARDTSKIVKDISTGKPVATKEPPLKDVTPGAKEMEMEAGINEEPLRRTEQFPKAKELPEEVIPKVPRETIAAKPGTQEKLFETQRKMPEGKIPAEEARPEARVEEAQLKKVSIKEEPAKNLYSVYKEIKERDGYRDIAISQLQKESGMPMEQIKDFLRQESRQGNVVLSRGDWSLSSETIRAGSIELYGTKHLLVRLKPERYGDVIPEPEIPEIFKMGATPDSMYELPGGGTRKPAVKVGPEVPRETVATKAEEAQGGVLKADISQKDKAPVKGTRPNYKIRVVEYSKVKSQDFYKVAYDNGKIEKKSLKELPKDIQEELAKSEASWSETMTRINAFKYSAENVRTGKVEFGALDDMAVNNWIQKKRRGLEPTPTGVGAKSIKSGKETPTDVVQLAQFIDGNIEGLKKPKEKISVAQKLAESYSRGKDLISRTMANAQATGQAILSSYKTEAKHTSFKDTLGDLMLSTAKADQATMKFSKSVLKVSPETREALVNYVQSNGDINLLRSRAGTTKNPKTKRGYENATKLNETEQILAQNIRQYFDSKLDQLQKEGLLEEGVENYFNQIWEKDPKFAENALAEINSGMLQKNPDFLKKKVHESYFAGEQTGKVALNKDIGFLISVYDNAFNKTLYSRKFVNDLKKSKSSDGKPLAISAAALNKSKTLTYNDYGIVDHPSFRQRKWVAEKDGREIFKTENIMVYNKPESALGISPLKHVRRMLYPSRIQAYAVGRAGLRVSGEAKATLLSFSPFHQTHVSIHAWEHKTRTWKLPEIDFDNPLTAKLVKNGLQLGGSHANFATFYEGLSGGALVHKIPVAGKYMYDYSQWLFMEAIPKIKLEMAKNAYERNVEVNNKRTRLRKLDDNQIAEMTAKQSNAAFGEQNYLWMGRSKTLQDITRLGLLAPDFLESRIKFVGQAFRPHGTEQRVALVRGALAMAVIAKTIEYSIGDAKDDEGKRTIRWKPTELLSAKIGDKLYGIRSVQGDLVHLLSNPRNFVYYRLNPTTTKAMAEWATGRNKYGQPRTTKEQIKDFFKEIQPIPVQDFQKKDATIISTVLHSAGFPSWTFRTDAENQARQFWFDKGVFVAAEENIDKNKLVRELIGMGRTGRPYERQMAEYFDTGKIKHADRLRVWREAKLTSFQSIAKRLSINEVEEVLKVANKSEKVWLNKLLRGKIARRDHVPGGKSRSTRSTRSLRPSSGLSRGLSP